MEFLKCAENTLVLMIFLAISFDAVKSDEAPQRLNDNLRLQVVNVRNIFVQHVEKSTNRLRKERDFNNHEERHNHKSVYQNGEKSSKECTKTCDMNEICYSRNGEDSCQCIEGFARKGKICFKCQIKCPRNQICYIKNEEHCQCKEGYAMLGTLCLECNEMCGVNEICLFEKRVPTCKCMETYVRLGENCTTCQLCNSSAPICLANSGKNSEMRHFHLTLNTLMAFVVCYSSVHL